MRDPGNEVGISQRLFNSYRENRNNIFEESSLKAFLKPSFRVLDFPNVSSDSRYFKQLIGSFYTALFFRRLDGC